LVFIDLDKGYAIIGLELYDFSMAWSAQHNNNEAFDLFRYLLFANDDFLGINLL